MRLSIRKKRKTRLEKFKFNHFSVQVQCMCVPGYPTCVCTRWWRPVCEQDVQAWWWQTTTHAWWGRTWQRWGWSGIWWWGWRTMPIASAWSYMHTRWGRGICLFNGRHTSSVFYSSITKILINQGVAWEGGGANIVYKDILLRAPWISDNPTQCIYLT